MSDRTSPAARVWPYATTRLKASDPVTCCAPGNRWGGPRPGLAWCAVAPGTTIRTTRARPTATTGTRTTATTTTGSGWCVRPTSTIGAPNTDRSGRSRLVGCGGGLVDGAGPSRPHAHPGVGRILQRGAARVLLDRGPRGASPPLGGALTHPAPQRIARRLGRRRRPNTCSAYKVRHRRRHQCASP
jgi:hypothetical protein